MCHQDDLYTPGSPIRQLLIKAAALDVRRYFRPLGKIVFNGRQRHVSELDWLSRFHRRSLTEGDMADFIRIYRVDQYMQWRLNRLTLTVMGWPSHFDEQLFQQRVDDLRECNHQRKRATSAASKLSFFVYPKHEVFIKDSYSSAAVEFRHPLGPSPRPSGYKNDEMANYYDAVCECLRDEWNDREDFKEALNAVVSKLNQVRDSVFGGHKDVVENFAARRLLDKLLYYEGKFLTHERKLRDILNGKWIRGLKRDIEAADRVQSGQGQLQAAE